MKAAYGDSVNTPLVLHSDTIRTEADSLMVAKREENLFPSAKGLPISIEKRVPVFGQCKQQPAFQAHSETGDCLPAFGLPDGQLQIRLSQRSCI